VSVTTRAQRVSTCPWCRGEIPVGATIEHVGRDWVHAECASDCSTAIDDGDVDMTDSHFRWDGQ